MPSFKSSHEFYYQFIGKYCFKSSDKQGYNLTLSTKGSHCTQIADSVQWLSQSDYSICIGILVELFAHADWLARRRLGGFDGKIIKWTIREWKIIPFSNCPFAVPSQAPSNLSATAKTSTSIEASWQLPPEDFRNGKITGFKLFHKKKSSSESSSELTINSGSTLTKVFIGLDKYAEYEFRILAFTSVGDGPNSTVMSVRTKEDG